MCAILAGHVLGPCTFRVPERYSWPGSDQWGRPLRFGTPKLFHGNNDVTHREAWAPLALVFRGGRCWDFRPFLPLGRLKDGSRLRSNRRSPMTVFNYFSRSLRESERRSVNGTISRSKRDALSFTKSNSNIVLLAEISLLQHSTEIISPF